MKAKVTKRGVTVPKELLEGMDEVEIYRRDGMVIIRPASGAVTAAPDIVMLAWDEDPIFQLGKDPITADDITNASVNHDRYIYRGK